MSGATEAQQRLVQEAARALARAGLVHAYGHCSLRLAKTHFLVSAARPLGTIADEAGTVVPLDGPLPDGVLGEVRAHREIYRLRPDVGGICRVMPPATMALSTQRILPAPRHGIGALVGTVAWWDDPRLLRDDGAAAALARALGDAAAIVMRGNGAITVGTGIERAVARAWFLEDAARIERDVRAMGLDPAAGLLDGDEVAARSDWAGGVSERMWAHLTAADR